MGEPLEHSNFHLVMLLFVSMFPFDDAWMILYSTCAQKCPIMCLLVIENLPSTRGRSWENSETSFIRQGHRQDEQRTVQRSNLLPRNGSVHEAAGG